MALQQLLTFSLLTLALASGTSEPTNGACGIKSHDGPYSYDPTSKNGPVHWGESEEWHACGDGNIQSPIDFPINVRYAPKASGPVPNIKTAEMELGAGSYNWALNCPVDSCGTTTVNGTEYGLVNMHFHSPSEHKLDGKQYPLEAHMVHASADGRYAVIATMFEEIADSYHSQVFSHAGKEYGTNGLLDSVLKYFGEGKTKFPVNMGSVINPDGVYCSYVGSLTTPPCSEGVTFFMSQTVFSVSKRQIAKYMMTAGITFVDGNNRPTQPLNGRSVTCYI